MSTSTLVTRSRPRLTPSDFWKIESMLTANGYSREMIEGMLNVTLFARLRNVIEGRAEIVEKILNQAPVRKKRESALPGVIVPPGLFVDLDADPQTKEGFKVISHSKGGMMPFSSANMLLCITHWQHENGGRASGEQLRETFTRMKTINANMLDFLLESKNQILIPEEWKKFYVFFWGTRYCCLHTHRECVWGLCWGAHGWEACVHWIDQGWSALRLALVPTNQYINPLNIVSLAANGLGDYHLVDRLKAA